ncbi:nitroreductase [Trichloromonas sp.]|uniref:nitroreductase n=1 Tax=Trichloromonas sp. TaxID=3069249 RepID=UPI003D814BC0
MDKRIEKLLQLATTAPSGDNCQPWQFSVSSQTVKLYNLSDKDTSLYNFAQRASLLAHGALLENLRIAAPSLGLRAQIEYFPDPSLSDLVATVEFVDAEVAEHPLLPWLSARCTNRKKYDGRPLSKAAAEILLHATGEIDGTVVRLVTDPEHIRQLSDILANNDRLVFENPLLHKFLFDHIRWNDGEARGSLDGMDLKTLELGLIDSLAFRVFRHWSIVEKLNKVGLPKVVANNGSKLLASASAIGGILIESSGQESFVVAGRAMQRFWLEATRLGLSVQPVAGLALLAERVLAGQTAGLTEGQVRLIGEVRSELDRIFGSAGKHLVMLFRIGTGGRPSARSLRQPVAQLVTG